MNLALEQILWNGANLAISILEYFNKNNILTVATTHYQELKRYAIVKQNVQNASVEFDIEKLKPTYKLLIGVPGKSNAFAISEKLGIKREIIDKARSLMSKQDINIEELLKSIYDNKKEIENKKNEIEKNLNQIQLLRKNLEKEDEKIKAQEKEILDKAKIEAREILLDAKQEASNLINEIKKMEVNSNCINQINNLRNNINYSIKEKSIKNISNVLAIATIDKSLVRPNAIVYVTNFSQNGTVLSNINKNDEVQIQIGSIKTKINIKYLEPAKNINSDKTSAQSHSKISKTKTISSEINVIGLTVEEAIPLIDKFLDDCFLAKLQTARIVHGKGTGKLRNRNSQLS